MNVLMHMLMHVLMNATSPLPRDGRSGPGSSPAPELAGAETVGQWVNGRSRWLR